MTNEWPEGDSDSEEEDVNDLGPGSADYDLSEEHGYRWEQEREGASVIPQGVMLAVTLIVLVALVLPTILLIYWYG